MKFWKSPPPKRTLQFGEGNFLRAFVDYWFDLANEKADWNGKCVLVQPIAIKINPADNVVVALHPIAKGTAVPVENTTVTAVEDIPQGHKMAIAPIKTGENVIKYGFPIGHATADAVPGT
ncbi:SAF domain-containing protein [Gemmiger sp.]|uniref:UxaA family hydrolase n=1 Tax=Gemmiger sp. TaxID=2049027 RepID=UPI0039C33016